MSIQEQDEMLEKLKLSIKQQYEYLSLDDLNTCYELALSDYVYLKYPSENNRPEKNKLELDFYAYQWIYARMLDILGRAGGTNVTSYKENGISFTYASSYIDPILASQIMPRVGIPK